MSFYASASASGGATAGVAHPSFFAEFSLTRTRKAAAAACAALLLVGSTEAAFADCFSSKLKAVAKAEFSALSCHSQVAARGEDSKLADCLAKTSLKLDEAFEKAGDCAGVLTSCDQVQQDCAEAVSTAMTVMLPSSCAAAKLKAAAKLAKSRLKCAARAAATLTPISDDCIDKADAQFAAAIDRAGDCPDGGSPLTLIETACVEPAIALDAQDMISAICTGPPTTTTSSTSTTESPTTTVMDPTTTTIQATTTTTAESTTTTSQPTTTTTLDPCNPNPCMNNGTCINEEAGFSCQCWSGTSGVLCEDACSDDPNKTEPGICGCNVSDTDSDSDGTADCVDACPANPSKTTAGGICGGCEDESDSDGDGTPDCQDLCAFDANKIDGGVCGCGVSDDDVDADGTADCFDGCPLNPLKTSPGGFCGGCEDESDIDGDGTPDCGDDCPADPAKIDAGVCGCHESDADADGDGTADCVDGCPANPTKNAPGGACGDCSDDVDTDGDATPDCIDSCPDDPSKTEPGTCGCGISDTDADMNGTPDCIEY